MDANYQKIIILCWKILFVASLSITSHGRVEGLGKMKISNFAPKPKGTIKIIEVHEDGELVDCVDIYKQPAFNDSLAKDLQMKPSLETILAYNLTDDPEEKIFQNWNKYGKCPRGTIPIRRAWKENDPFSRKKTNNQLSHEYAGAATSEGVYYTASAYLNVWNPQIQEGVNEYSSSQLWLESDKGRPGLNTIETGWIATPDTRLFVYWTRDSYQTTGCYNLNCQGFVQIHDKIIVGMELPFVSIYNGNQVELYIHVFKDISTGNWWLRVRNINVGYFPSEIFTSLNDGANVVKFGGKIVNQQADNRHTTTQMGSGHFASEGLGNASFIRNAKVGYTSLLDADLSPFLVTNPNCYDLVFGPPYTSFGSHFYFGGPGRSEYCP